MTLVTLSRSSSKARGLEDGGASNAACSTNHKRLVRKCLAYLSEMNFTESRKGYIVMEKVPGAVLAESIDALDEAAVADVGAKQLKEYVEELHKLDGQGWGLPGKDGCIIEHISSSNWVPSD